MPTSGTISHIDMSVGYPDRSIPFYEAFLTGLGFIRMSTDHPGFVGPSPSRAWWSIKYPDGSRFGIEVRPADPEKRDQQYDRYRPGPHHLAFHAETRSMVNDVHDAMIRIGASVLDPPTDYSGQSGYSDGYYAVFFADPDGVKLEVVHLPGESDT